MNRDKFITTMLLVAGMVIFGTATPVSKYISDELPTYLASFMRVLLAALFLTPYLIHHRSKINRINRQEWLKIFIIGAIGTFLFTISLIESTSRLSGVTSSFFMSLVPVVTGVGAIIFFDGKLTPRKFWGMLLAVIGVAVVNIFGTGSAGNTANNSVFAMGVGLILLAVVSEATFTLAGSSLSKKLSPIIVTGLASWIAALLFSPLAFTQLPQLANIQGDQILALIWWGGGTMAGGTIIWYLGLQRATALNSSIFMSVMPVSALLFSYILLDEQFLPIHLPGIFLVVVGILIFNTSRND